MKKQSSLIAAIVAVAAMAGAASVQAAPKWDASGWRVHDVPSTRSNAEVRAELDQFKKGPNPWSASYSQRSGFQGQKTRAQVQAEYLASRDAVAAMTAEDSGAAYLASGQKVAAPVVAGQPVNPR